MHHCYTTYLMEAGVKKILAEIKKDKLNQENLTMLVKEIIKINMNYIWTDALEKYGLLDKT